METHDHSLWLFLYYHILMGLASRPQASFYNNFTASQNCVGGSEYGCGPGAIAPRSGIARIM
jgi:hypothetical protein